MNKYMEIYTKCLDSKNIKYDATTTKNGSYVIVTGNVSNGQTLTVTYLFGCNKNNDGLVGVCAYFDRKIDKNKRVEALGLCNELNIAYDIVKFSLIEGMMTICVNVEVNEWNFHSKIDKATSILATVYFDILSKIEKL